MTMGYQHHKIRVFLFHHVMQSGRDIITDGKTSLQADPLQ